MGEPGKCFHACVDLKDVPWLSSYHKLLLPGNPARDQFCWAAPRPPEQPSTQVKAPQAKFGDTSPGSAVARANRVVLPSGQPQGPQADGAVFRNSASYNRDCRGP
jgi:hypothetical protein